MALQDYMTKAGFWVEGAPLASIHADEEVNERLLWLLDDMMKKCILMFRPVPELPADWTVDLTFER